MAYTTPPTPSAPYEPTLTDYINYVVNNFVAYETHQHTGTKDGSGTLLQANGSAASPSGSFSGDTNTGTYNAGADQYGISTGGTSRVIISSSGVAASVGVKSSEATQGVGYATGAGGAITQITSKATSVTLNKVCGQITTHNAALAAGASVTFQLANTTIAATDTVIVSIGDNAATDNVYRIEVAMVVAAGANLRLTNTSGGSLSEAVLINFAVIKAVAA